MSVSDGRCNARLQALIRPSRVGDESTVEERANGTGNLHFIAMKYVIRAVNRHKHNDTNSFR